MALIEFTRIYLAAFYTLVAIFYTVRIISMKRQMNTEVVFVGERYCSNWKNHITFRLFRLLIWGSCLLRLYQPSFDGYLGLFPALQFTPVILTGVILLTLGFTATVILNVNMGKDWRSGIDPNGPHKIISSGIYQYSRNPMFVCVAISQLGFFLALPSVFSLVCLIVGVYTLNSQAIVEEKHLLETSNQDYQTYYAKVRRWI